MPGPVHEIRTREIALAIGRAMGLGERDLLILATAAQEHDIGKVVIPRAVLDKAGVLDEEERAEVEKHSAAGERILLMAARMVRAHHERWDGRGYPDGLSGDEIPVLARILHVADVIDALLSDRVYRRAMTLSEVRDVLDEGRGSDFCPDIVSVVESLVHRRT